MTVATRTIPLFRVFMADEARDAVGDTLASGYVGQGPRVDEFEREFGALVEAPESPLALNSCTSAIELACRLIGVGPGDEVITTPITCTATNSPPALLGATLVWADVGPLTGNIDPADVARKVTRRTKAIVAVDWAGRACDYGGLRDAVGHYRLHFREPGRYIPIIEDAAHALLARTTNVDTWPIAYREPGTYPGGGDFICFSFQAIKHLTTGDGGALLTPPASMERARLLRWYGLDRRSTADFRCAQDITEIGGKWHMADIAASIGLANLPHARRIVEAHRANARYYDEALADVPGVTLPPPDPGCSSWLYSLLVEDRPAFMAFMAERGIATSQVHRRNDTHTAFRAVGRGGGEPGVLPGVDYFDAHQCAIPVGWWLTDEDRERIVEAVRDYARRGA